GAVVVESTNLLTFLFVVVVGGIGLLLLFFPWDGAAKGGPGGGRPSAGVGPGAGRPQRPSGGGVGAAGAPGAPLAPVSISCNDRTAACQCTPANACRGVTGYDRAAMNTIVFGRGSSSCSDAKSADNVGMCDIFPRITPANVKIVYAQTGLGYAGRPGGPM